MTERNRRRCYWADTCPAGLQDAANGWGITSLDSVFRKAHSRAKYHDDSANPGHCYVCGAQLDFEAWLDEQDEKDKRERGA